MPTSTPDPGQKTCLYCNTPAAPLATQCANCGSALPVALPRPVARMVEAQSRWSMGKTALVTMAVSFGLGALTNATTVFGVLVAVLLGFWLMFFLPGMLFLSAFISTRRNAGLVVLNLVAATGLWGLGVLVSVIAAFMY
ncbi:MAG: hypothetical protein L3J37_02320 [Rhodobacteraceae bacterium]|nr:hypothetical protein [Paracoccaceae bacterium]